MSEQDVPQLETYKRFENFLAATDDGSQLSITLKEAIEVFEGEVLRADERGDLLLIMFIDTSAIVFRDHADDPDIDFGSFSSDDMAMVLRECSDKGIVSLGALVKSLKTHTSRELIAGAVLEYLEGNWEKCFMRGIER